MLIKISLQISTLQSKPKVSSPWKKKSNPSSTLALTKFNYPLWPSSKRSPHYRYAGEKNSTRSRIIDRARVSPCIFMEKWKLWKSIIGGLISRVSTPRATQTREKRNEAVPDVTVEQVPERINHRIELSRGEKSSELVNQGVPFILGAMREKPQKMWAKTR